MGLIRCAFRCPRPIWFRPSAIAVGWVLAQFLDQLINKGTLTGTCGDGSSAWRCP